MPTLPPETGLGFIRYQLAGDNEPMVTTVHYTTDLASGSADDHAATLSDAWIGQWTAAVTFSQYTYLGVRVVEGNTSGPPTPGTHDLSIQGTRSGNPLTQNCAFLLHKRTATPGRSGQGRNYLPPISVAAESEVTATGGIDSTAVTGANSALSAILAEMAGADLPLVVLDKLSVAHLITSWTIDPVIATRRTRLRR